MSHSLHHASVHLVVQSCLVGGVRVQEAPEGGAAGSGVPVLERLRSLTWASLSWTCFISCFSSRKRCLAASAAPASQLMACSCTSDVTCIGEVASWAAAAPQGVQCHTHEVQVLFQGFEF